ncbi:hypothetical protein [Caulobacter sp. BP25]|uniref:hypothetical protein n=1 Tax=Caulobacter sp. BP25 TaxID=2048900 RepID=UPI000C12A92F|nr:hypothetical protein [Caulobacter sp. BP25]PHY20791.1 hypothetical protein CSW59_06090 [Caulobacter sp. BP25]
MSVQNDFQGRPVDLQKVRARAVVTDHALLRHIERVLLIPVEEIRADMLTDNVLLAMALKAPSVRAHDHQIVFAQDNPFVIVTVLTPSMHVRRSRRRKARWQKFQGQG